MINKIKCLLGMHDWIYDTKRFFVLNEKDEDFFMERASIIRKCENCKFTQRRKDTKLVNWKKY